MLFIAPSLATFVLWSAPTVDRAHPAPTEETARPARILITEIMYDPASRETGGATEWVELANIGGQSITLQNWRLDDEDRSNWGPINHRLEPGGVLVLINARAVTEAAFRAAWDDHTPGVPVPNYAVLPVKWGGLSNEPSHDNEILVLLNDRGSIVCRVNLNGDPAWPDGHGASVYLVQPGRDDPDQGSSWRRSTIGEGGARWSRKTPVFNETETGSPGWIPGLAEVAAPPDDTHSAVTPSPAELERDPSHGR
ncbi:MAG: lamin tail domain-containing protein [Phycisphaerales bacterium]|nr:lamin tail domain-containing protein [Phycisphaerales bacterium]